MKKKTIITVSAIAAAVVLIVAGIFAWRLLSKDKLTVEVNTEFDLSTLEGYTDYADLKITYQGEKVPVEKEKIIFDKLGVYKVSGKGLRYEITAEDTTAPVVQLMGSLMKLQATDEVELPEVRVVDNYDESIKDYTLNVYSGETEVSVENQAFYVPDSGDYVIRMSAKDSSGNQGKNEKLIHVTPLFDKKVKVGEVVEIRSSWITYLLPAGSGLEDYDFSYKIYRNGTQMDAEDNKFTAEGNCYYNVCITASSKKNEGESYSGWIIFVEEHARMLTFTTMTTDEVGVAGYNLICNPYDQITRGVKDYGDGRFVMNMDVDVEDFPAKDNTIMLAWPVDAWALPKDITDYDASFSMTLRGKLKANTSSAEFVAGGYDNQVQNIRVEGADGAFECTEQISTEKVAAFTEGGVTRIYYILTVPKEKLAELEIEIDNFQLTPKAPPIYTGEEYLPKELGDRVELTEEDLGLAATDCLGGTVQSIEITGVKQFDEDVQGKRREFNGDALTEKGIYFIACHITDYYGNEADAEMIVSIGMGVLDVKAPVITVDTIDHMVPAGTVIELREDGMGDYLTIEDESPCKVTYQVYRNGKEVKAGSSITVGAYDRYEIYVTATDSSILENTTTGYIHFLENGLKGSVATMDTDDYEPMNYGGESHLIQNGIYRGFFYPFDSEVAIENGNPYLKLLPRKADVDRLEILFPCNPNERGLTASFDFKVGGTLSGRLSDSTVLFEIDGQAITVADMKAGKRFSYTTSNLYNRLPDETGTRTQAVFLENCGNFLKEKGLYLCVDNIQTEKMFEDLYSESNSFNTLALNKTGIVVNNSDTVLKLVDTKRYELSYEVYRNGSEKVNSRNITRSGYEYYEVHVRVLQKETKQLRTSFKMTFQWDADVFITMENGEKCFRVPAANGNPAYDQLLDGRDTFLMEMFPFLGEFKKDGQNNTYLALTPADLRDGAALSIININDASEHRANVGFTFWIEGDVSGLPGDTLLALVGNTEVRAKDIGTRFTYENKLTFNGCFSDAIQIRSYDVLYERGLKLCVDNIWRKKIVEENLFQGKYSVINVCDSFSINSSSIVTDRGTALALSDSSKFELVCDVYKNGAEQVGAADIRRQGNDFYSVNVKVRNKSTGKIHGSYALIFAGKTDSFVTLEQGEKFYRILANGENPAYDQLVDVRDTFLMNLYPFIGSMKEADGNTFMALKASKITDDLSLSIVNIEDASEHRADVGFTFWIEGDVSGVSAESVVAKIGDVVVRASDVGRKFYYQNQLTFNGCFAENIMVEDARLLAERGLTLCIDNVWRTKNTSKPELPSETIVNVTLVPGGEAGSFWIHPDTPDDFYPNNGQDAIGLPQAVMGGIYVNGELNPGCKLEKYAWGDYRLVLNKPAAEGTVVVLEGSYGRGSDDPAYGDDYKVKYTKVVFQYKNGSWKEGAEEGPEEPEEPKEKTLNVALVPGEAAGSLWIHPDTPDDFYPNNGQDAIGLPQVITGGISVNGELNPECRLEKYAWGDYLLILNEEAVEGTVVVLDGSYGRSSDDPAYGDDYKVKFNKAIFQYTERSWKQLDEIPEIPEEPKETTVNIALVPGTEAGSFWMHPDIPDDFHPNAGQDAVGAPAVITGGIYVNGELNPECSLEKYAWGDYRLVLNEAAAEGTVVVLDGVYGRGIGDPAYGDKYQVRYNMAIFQYTERSWKQLDEIPKDPEDTVDKTLTVTLVPGEAAGSFWIHPDTPDDFYPNNGQDAIGMPQVVTGSISVNGELNSECRLEKYAWGDYQLVLNEAAAEGTVVVLDGIYGRGNDDPAHGDDYRVKFNKAIFQYTERSWKQLDEIPEKLEIKADAEVDVKLDNGDASNLWIIATPGDDFYTADTWAETQVPVTGGVYVDGILNNGCVLKKFSWAYYIALVDGGVTATEGTTVAIDGIYGRWLGDPKYGDDYKVKFNKATFRYTNGKWVESTR